MTSEVLIVIPVRGGSQGIPRKALRPLGGIPPLVRTIRTALEVSPYVIVATDDAEIMGLAGEAGAAVAFEEPIRGQRTLDQSVWDAIGARPETPYVATVQCTSPLLTASTIRGCVALVQSGVCETALTVRDDRHVAWTGSLGQPQLTTAWDIRQHLPPRWVLTGGCVATKRSLVTPARRFGGTIRLVEVGGAEAVDLDVPADWALAEWYAGAPSTRECLMARVLGDQAPVGAQPVTFSAWDEETDDTTFREAALGRLIRMPWRVTGAHTRAEAEAVVPLLQLPMAATDVALLTSAYHQVRTFLTVLAVLREYDLHRRVRLWNVPAASRMDKLAGEWAKIAEYQRKGHVASLEDGLAYLDWRDRASVPCEI